MDKHPHPAIHVAATKDNFRRAGREFGTVPKTIPLGALSEAQHAAILGDRSLVVIDTVIHLDEAEAGALSHHDAPHVKRAAAQMAHLTPHVTKDDDERTLALSGIEAELQQRTEALDSREAALATCEVELAARTTEFDKRSAGLVSRENELLARIQAFEAEREAAKSSKTAQTSGKRS